MPTKLINQNQPDYLIILAWIHADKIIQKNQNYLENGGVFDFSKNRNYKKITIIMKCNVCKNKKLNY